TPTKSPTFPVDPLSPDARLPAAKQSARYPSRLPGTLKSKLAALSQVLHPTLVDGDGPVEQIVPLRAGVKRRRVKRPLLFREGVELLPEPFQPGLDLRIALRERGEQVALELRQGLRLRAGRVRPRGGQ